MESITAQPSVFGLVRNIESDRLIATLFAFGRTLVAYTPPPRTFGVHGSVKF